MTKLENLDHLPALDAWLESLIGSWDEWARARDAAWLALPTGNERHPKLGILFRHTFTPLARYADGVASVEPRTDEGISADDWPALRDWARTCLARHREVGATVESPAEVRNFKTRSAGKLRTTPAIALTHAVTHAVWHLGGIAHLLRAAGIAPPQDSDLIFRAGPGEG